MFLFQDIFMVFFSLKETGNTRREEVMTGSKGVRLDSILERKSKHCFLTVCPEREHLFSRLNQHFNHVFPQTFQHFLETGLQIWKKYGSSLLFPTQALCYIYRYTVFKHRFQSCSHPTQTVNTCTITKTHLNLKTAAG